MLENIRNISASISTAEFSALFFETEYKATNGKKNPEYLMNRDGFSLIVMGFTGKKALEWKLKYIDAFNQMEERLSCRPLPKMSMMEKSADLFQKPIRRMFILRVSQLKIVQRDFYQG